MVRRHRTTPPRPCDVDARYSPFSFRRYSLDAPAPRPFPLCPLRRRFPLLHLPWFGFHFPGFIHPCQMVDFLVGTPLPCGVDLECFSWCPSAPFFDPLSRTAPFPPHESRIQLGPHQTIGVGRTRFSHPFFSIVFSFFLFEPREFRYWSWLTLGLRVSVPLSLS